MLTKNDDLVNQLKKDYRKADITNAEMAMLNYTEKLTRVPWEMEKMDVEKLKSAKFTDADILDINQVAAYFAFVNRLADGLGVGLEPYWDEE